MIAMPGPISSRTAVLIAVGILTGCVGGPTSSGAPSCSDTDTPSEVTASPTSGRGDVVIVGRIVTMDEPAIAEALLIEDGAVAAIGDREDVVALACEGVPVVDISDNVAYPGFIDAHAHWIGDRDY